MVEVFKTNVKKVRDAKVLVKKLLVHLPKSKINFDLADCDKVLRIESKTISPDKIIILLQENGYQCQVLE